MGLSPARSKMRTARGMWTADVTSEERLIADVSPDPVRLVRRGARGLLKDDPVFTDPQRPGESGSHPRRRERIVPAVPRKEEAALGKILVEPHTLDDPVERRLVGVGGGGEERFSLVPRTQHGDPTDPCEFGYLRRC